MYEPMRSLVALLLLAGALDSQDVRDQRIAFLEATLSADLAELGAMIGDAEVVFLGEASHGDGTTFEKKVEICRYLHQRLGFSVLIFESGLYPCRKAWQQICEGRDPSAAARDAVFSVWSRSAQVAPLWRYLGEQSKSKNPLELAGFDFQPSGSHTKKTLLADVEAAVKTHAPVLHGSDPWKAFVAPYLLMQDDKGFELREYPEAAQASFQEGTERIADALRAEAPFVAQAIRSHGKFMRFMWRFSKGADATVFNWREEQGAENFLWLRDHAYKGRKLIVWGATSHLSRNRQKIETTVAPKMVPFGHHVAERLGKKLFILGFVAHGGTTGIARKGAKVQEISAPPKGSFADLMGGTTHGSGYVDLRSATWLREPRIARPMGHSPMTADWSQVLDALCFVRKMRPSRLVEPPGKQ